MAISYQRDGGRSAPPQRERLTIGDDGRFEMQRAVGARSVGRFTGTLPGDLRARIEEEAAGAAQEPAPAGTQLPDAARELVDLGHGPLDVGRDTVGHLGELRIVLGEALDQLVDQPVAAIRLVVAPDGASATLTHEGTEPVEVDLEGATVTAVLSSSAWEAKGDWRSGPLSLGRATAGSGWSAALPFEGGLAPAEGDHLVVEVTGRIVDGPVTVGVRWAVDDTIEN
jgi:hypothetical protein